MRGHLPHQLAWAVLAPAGALLGACGGPDAPARVVYPAPWIGPTVGRLAQASVDAWGTPRAVEIPDSLLARVGGGAGYTGDIDFAQAMVAVPGVAAAVGPQSSRATLLVGPIYVEARIPLIAPTATTHRLADLAPWVFQLAPDDRAEGAFLARFILDHLGLQRITVFHLVNDEYGLDLRDALVEALDRRGVTPVDNVPITLESDFEARVAESLRRAVPEVVVVAARGPEAVAITRALHARAPGTPLVVGDGAPLDSSFGVGEGPGRGPVYGVAWWHSALPDSLSRSFVARFREAQGVFPSPGDAMYYDAIMLAARAVREVGPAPGAVRRYLSELGSDRPPFQGITGPIAFGPQRPVNLLMARLEGDSVALVEMGEGR